MQQEPVELPSTMHELQPVLLEEKRAAGTGGVGQVATGLSDPPRLQPSQLQPVQAPLVR